MLLRQVRHLTAGCGMFTRALGPSWILSVGAFDGLSEGMLEAIQAWLDAEVEQLAASLLAKPRVAMAIGKALFYRLLCRRAGLEHWPGAARAAGQPNRFGPASPRGHSRDRATA